MDKESQLRDKESQLRDEKRRLMDKERRLMDKESQLRNKESQLRDKESQLLKDKKEIEQREGGTKKDDRIATITFNLDEKTLQNDDTDRFAARVWEMFKWHSDTNFPKTWIAPYFPVVQSSGSGKTKMMGMFRNGTSFSSTDGNVWNTVNLSHKGKLSHSETEPDVTIISLLCYQEGHREPSLDNVFDGVLPVPVGKQDEDRDSMLAGLNAMARRAETDKVVFLFDEAQHLLRRDSWHFRCVRWWLRESSPEHGKQIVAVFAGTTSQLTKFHEEVPTTSNTRDPNSNYHELGTGLLPPFYQIYTTGLYKWKKGFKMPPNATEFEKSVVYGRPLFAGLMEQNREQFWNAQPTILRKLLICHPSEDWPSDGVAKASILGTRLQMGETSLQIASDLVAKGYATLTCYNEAGSYAQIAYPSDPVLARLAMCFMIPEYDGMEIPMNTKNAANSNIRSWSGYMADIFSNAICLADKGDIGEIGVALYMLLCGDSLRYASDPGLKSLSIPVDRFLDLAINPTIKEFHGLNATHNSDLTLNFIQVTREHLRFRNVTKSFPLSDWYLRSLYESAQATYAADSRPVYDLLIPIRLKDQMPKNSRKRGDTYTYVPMLVSVKNKFEFTRKEATNALVSMQQLMNELRGDEKGIAVLVLVGLCAPRWESTFSKSLFDATGIDGISYNNQLDKQRMQLTNEAKGQFILVIHEDDPFGVSQSLRSCAVNEREGEVHQSSLSIKNAAFKFLEKEFQGKEDLLWYGDTGGTKALQALLRLIEERNKEN